MNEQIRLQLFPPHLDEVCEWLSSAERYDAEPRNDRDILASITAGEALSVLADVFPPYPLLTDRYVPRPLVEVMPNLHQAIERVLAQPGLSVELRLRIARAERVLDDHVRMVDAEP